MKINGRLSALIEVTAGFHPELTGRENVYLNGTILGMRRKEIDDKFDEIVEFSGVSEFIDTPVKRYSSGMLSQRIFCGNI
jgi:lipopolysaccharide transport system ATP-binding protein